MKQYSSKYGFPSEEMDESLRMEHIEKGKKIALEISPVIESVLEDYLKTYQHPLNKQKNRGASEQVGRSIEMIFSPPGFGMWVFGRWMIVDAIFGPNVCIELATITSSRLENPYLLGCSISGQRSWFVRTVLEKALGAAGADIVFSEKELAE